MRVTELRITHFGKLHNMNISLSDGINLIEGPNESGKSTIHAFVYAMLFGNERARGRAAKDDPYVRYQPWDTPGAYQGSMDFEYEGEIYRLERIFYKKERKCTLTQVETGKVIKLPDEKITSFIPELTESAYRNTVSAMQLHVRTEASLAGEVRNFIANLSIAGDSEVDVPASLAVLAGKKKQLENSLRTERIEELRLMLEKDRRQEEHMDALARQQNRLMQDQKEVRAELEQLLDSDEYKSIDRANEFPVIVEKFKNFQTLSDDIGTCEQRLLRLQAQINEISEKNSCEKPLKQEHDELISCSYENEAGGMRKSMQRSIMLIIFGVIIFAAMLGRVKVVLAVAVFSIIAVAAAALLFAGVMKERRVKRELFLQEEERRRRLVEIDGILRECVQRRTMTEQLERQLCEYNTELVERMKQRSEQQESLQRALLEFAHEPQLTGQFISNLGRDLEQKRGRVLRKKDELLRCADELEKQLAPIAWELEKYAETETDVMNREQEYKDLIQNQELVNRELEALSLAITTIKGLSGSIHDVFGKKLNSLLSSVVTRVTGGAYTEAVIDEDLNIKLMNCTGFVALEKLSAGTVEQIFLALRIILGDLFFENLHMMMIFDESFVYFDDERLENMLGYIVRECRGQIILLSCRDRERKMLEHMQAEFTHIVLRRG